MSNLKFSVKYSVHFSGKDVEDLAKNFQSEMTDYLKVFDKDSILQLERDKESHICLFFYKCGNGGVRWEDYYALLKDFYQPNKKKKTFIGVIFTQEQTFTTLLPSYSDLSNIPYNIIINPIRENLFTFEYRSNDILKTDLYKERIAQIMKFLLDNQK